MSSRRVLGSMAGQQAWVCYSRNRINIECCHESVGMRLTLWHVPPKTMPHWGFPAIVTTLEKADLPSITLAQVSQQGESWMVMLGLNSWTLDRKSGTTDGDR